MAYYINLFSPDTYEAFAASDKTIAGFGAKKQSIAQKICQGDKLICYVTELSRWVGILKVEGNMFRDDTPIYYPVNDPFTIRFKVKPEVWLSFDHSIPVQAPRSYHHLSFTKELPKGSNAWTTSVRSSLRRITDEDGAYLEKILKEQATAPVTYELSDIDNRKIRNSATAIRDTGAVDLTIPDSEDVVGTNQFAGKESIRIQAKLAEMGEKMGFKIWLPKSDRLRVLEHWSAEENTLLNILPLNYIGATLKTIENIDVLWIKKNMIVRAFEVEHTTSIYSGILRMADLLALQPNINVKLHIVAPQERRDKVLQEITRPVFSYMEIGEMKDSCTYLSYESILLLSGQKHINRLHHDVLDDYEEVAGKD